MRQGANEVSTGRFHGFGIRLFRCAQEEDGLWARTGPGTHQAGKARGQGRYLIGCQGHRTSRMTELVLKTCSLRPLLRIQSLLFESLLSSVKLHSDLIAAFVIMGGSS